MAYLTCASLALCAQLLVIQSAQGRHKVEKGKSSYSFNLRIKRHFVAYFDCAVLLFAHIGGKACRCSSTWAAYFFILSPSLPPKLNSNRTAQTKQTKLNDGLRRRGPSFPPSFLLFAFDVFNHVFHALAPLHPHSRANRTALGSG